MALFKGADEAYSVYRVTEEGETTWSAPLDPHTETYDFGLSRQQCGSLSAHSIFPSQFLNGF
jgi:hypothetical protein